MKKKIPIQTIIKIGLTIYEVLKGITKFIKNKRANKQNTEQEPKPETKQEPEPKQEPTKPTGEKRKTGLQ